MERFRNLPIVLCFMAISVSCVPCISQAPTVPPPPGIQPRPVPETQVVPPFAVSTSASKEAKAVEYRPEAQMSAEDLDLVARDRLSIEEGADFAGMQWNQSKWNYDQVVCPVLPDYLLLLFRSQGSQGNESLFSAAIPRRSAGHVRVIPILRHGFSLYTPASTNPLTIAVFNQLRASEPSSRDADWLTTGLCYAALAGAHLVVSPTANKGADETLSWDTAPTLEISSKGGAIIRFVDATVARQVVDWGLIFDAKGRLLKVTLTPEAMPKARRAP